MMKEDTKACNLTENEVRKLIIWHGYNMSDDISGHLDRMNYLHKRLKEFKKAETANNGWVSN